MKYLFVVYETQDGERRYSTPAVVQIHQLRAITAKTLLKYHYDYTLEVNPVFNEEWLELYHGECMVRTARWQDITEDEFNILKRFI